MKVTRDMLHNDLKSSYIPMKITASRLSKVWGLKMMNRLDAGLKGRCIEGVACEEHLIPSRSGDPDIQTRAYDDAFYTAMGAPIKGKGVKAKAKKGGKDLYGDEKFEGFD